jgi:1-acyl-sn-glycerol-3-phosphate acyltransferase
MRVLYSLAYHLVQVLVRLFFRVEVEGVQNVPPGGCLVVSNHLSWADTIFIAYALPRHPTIHTMASRATVFNSGLKRWLMPKFGVFPVNRSRGQLDEEAVNAVYELLERGERVLVFPEGAYGRDGQLRPLKDGVGYFALNSGKPLLPISLAGTGRLRPWSKVRVVIGQPFVPEPPRLLELKLRVRDVVDNVGRVLGRLGRHSARESSVGGGLSQASAVETHNPEIEDQETAREKG